MYIYSSESESSGQIQQQKIVCDNPMYAPSYETVEYETVIENHDYEQLDDFRDSLNDNETQF